MRLSICLHVRASDQTRGQVTCLIPIYFACNSVGPACKRCLCAFRLKCVGAYCWPQLTRLLSDLCPLGFHFDLRGRVSECVYTALPSTDPTRTGRINVTSGASSWPHQQFETISRSHTATTEQMECFSPLGTRVVQWVSGLASWKQPVVIYKVGRGGRWKERDGVAQNICSSMGSVSCVSGASVCDCLHSNPLCRVHVCACWSCQNKGFGGWWWRVGRGRIGGGAKLCRMARGGAHRLRTYQTLLMTHSACIRTHTSAWLIVSSGWCDVHEPDPSSITSLSIHSVNLQKGSLCLSR